MGHAPAVRVKQRNRMQADAVSRSGKRKRHSESVKIDVAMREHHAFGVSAGSAGIEKFTQGVFIKLHHVGMIRRGSGKKVFIALGRHPCSALLGIQGQERLDRMQVLAEGLYQTRELVFKEKELCFRIVKNICELLRGQPYIQWQQDSTGL